jgi:hypothetical protein
MFEKGSGSPAGLDVRAALAAAVERRRTADRAEADLLALAAHWADLHAVLPGDEPARHQLDGGRERIVPLAGPGAPEVAEFAPADLGAALGLTTYSAERLIGDALELRHRLPRLWLRVHDTVRPVQAWRARRIADHTKGLSVEAAAWVDAKVAPVAHKIGIDRTLRLVEAAILRFDPETAAERALPRARTDAASGSTRRWSTATWDFGSRRTRWMPARSTPPSRWCPRRSPSAATRTPAQARRAKAIGYLADPEAARQLLSGETPVGTGRKANGTRPRLNLYVHLHEDAITSNQGGVARVE